MALKGLDIFKMSPTVVCEPIVYGMGYRFGLARIAFTTETGIYKGKKKV